MRNGTIAERTQINSPTARWKPLTTFGNVKADVLALKDMSYVRQNFCSIILGSGWPS